MARLPLQHEALLDNYKYRKNKAFLLMKCIGQYAYNVLVIILSLV